MLQIKNISKKYVTGDLVQNALNDVSFNLRDNEFVAILGPSGSGKTTLLNIIGGLDRYDSGDLIINGISTKKYKDRDWDSYRNHTIGFVFQSYNLIPHQSVLSNVELALTISGISKSERKKRAVEALEKVGLGNQLKKRPNQMSGGQMQRVAIARALVNDPDILLADEPTGALDSETSVQVMELLKEVAKDRLVVMVTHNGDLAEQYATRTIRLKDGVIQDDTKPFEIDDKNLEPPKHKNMGHSSMSFLTALSLSFNNLRTKKGRTILTAFAGSIGIIGIALILSLSTGVNNYINDVQRETMLSYPITISETTIDLSGFIATEQDNDDFGELKHELDAVYANSTMMEMASTMTTSITENNLTKFKKYIENPDSEINQYIGETGVVYSYSPDYDIYTYDDNGALVNTDGSTLVGMKNPMSQSSGLASMFGSSMSLFEEMIPGKNELVSPAVTDSYDVVYGSWPNEWNEIVIVLNRRNEIPSTMLYQLGFLPTEDYQKILKDLMAGEEPDVPDASFSYKDACDRKFTLVPAAQRYRENDNGTFTYIGEKDDGFEEILKDGIKLKICGIIRPKEDSDTANIRGNLAYTKALTDKIIELTDESTVVKAQKDSPERNVTSGLAFSPADDASKISDAKKYLEGLNISEKAAICSQLMKAMYAGNEQMTATFEQMGEAELAAALDQYLLNPDDQILITLYDTYISTGTYDDNLKLFGVVSKDAPSSIAIYVDSFEDKDSVALCIREYNENAEPEDQITYTDYIGLLISSVTTIINTISYILIAFVSVSLVVSSIMIGIITFISVLERTKEIGILRAIGASKRNVSQVFNAETFIIGLFSGLMGIGITELLLIPANVLIHVIGGNNDVNAVLPLEGAIVLVILSMALTLIAGLIPSSKAAKKDPVTALRTE